jgi:HSP20 family protein
VAPGTYPAINIGTTPDSIEVYAFAPGLDAGRLEVTLDRGVLTLSGERASLASAECEGRQANVYTQERPVGRFKRSVSLPEDADPEQVSARYRDGILQVSVGRKASLQPKRIAIQ